MQTPDSRVIREFNDRGLIWFLEAVSNVRDLVQILSREVADSLDFSRAERVNRSFISEDLYKKEADMIFRVPFSEGEGEVIVYLLIEHQTDPDRTMGLRFYSYMSEIWQEQKRLWQDLPTPKSPLKLHPVIPVLLYTGEDSWKAPVSLATLMDLPSMLERFVPQYSLLQLRLRDISKEELTQGGSVISWLLRLMKFSNAPFSVLSEELEEAIRALERLPEERQTEWKRALHFVTLLIRHKRDRSERIPLYEQVEEAIDVNRRKEVVEMVLTDAQELMLEGEKIGHQRGREEGREFGKSDGWRELLLSQLQFKFTTLPESIQARIMEISDEEIQALSMKVLTATTLEEMGF